MFEQGFGNSPTSSRMPSPPRRRSPSPTTESRVQYKIRLERVVSTPGTLTQHWASRSSYQRDAPQVTSVCMNNPSTGLETKMSCSCADVFELGQYFYTFVDENGYEMSQTNGRELILEIDQVEGVITIDAYAEAQRIGCGSISVNSLVNNNKSVVRIITIFCSGRWTRRRKNKQRIFSSNKDYTERFHGNVSSFP